MEYSLHTSTNISTVTTFRNFVLVEIVHENLTEDSIVTCIPIAMQRHGKNVPAGANARNIRMSIARQRISKHASLTVESVFSAWPVPRGYKMTQSEDRTKYKVMSRVSERQPIGM
jgi:hypothetical protein